MASIALQRWNTIAQAALDEIEAAHQAIGGHRRGRRYATLQVNHAYAMLLSSQFQGFCRELHMSAVDFLVANVQPVSVRTALYSLMIQGRKLDQGNPNPGNLGADFSRLGLEFWTQVNALGARNAGRQRQLDELAKWRNAIAHQDWSKLGPELRLKQVQRWRSTCRAMATAFDVAVGLHLANLVGSAPW